VTLARYAAEGGSHAHNANHRIQAEPTHIKYAAENAQNKLKNLPIQFINILS
jgi:hypothetical protein